MGSDRQQKLRTWLGENGYEKASITDLSGDASFRRYYRVKKKIFLTLLWIVLPIKKI